MRYLVIFFLALATLAACSNDETREDQKADTANIGVDSTKVGADSGILRKLP